MKTRHSMAAMALVGATVALSPLAQAQEVATVISSMPILEHIQTPVEVCANRQVTVNKEKSGGGAVIGAIAGGAVGNAIGQGSGNALATAIGVIGGAVLGDRIEGSPGQETQTVRDCHTEMRSETRVKSYRVVYEYAGKRYEIETPKEPGKTIPITISPGVPLSQARPSSPVTASTVRHAPVRVAVAAPVQTAIVVGYEDVRHLNTQRPHRSHRHEDQRRWRRDDWDSHWR